MKMVSTRGVKFKFEKSEIVLCYEPDPTKAKVLYESKVLDVGLRKDKYGRKIPEYLVHFNGWNNSWDRFVPEELILEDNEENRALQQLLAQQAIVKLKSNKKRRLIEALLTDKRRRSKTKMGQVIEIKRRKNLPKRTNSNGKSVKLNILENLLRIPDPLKRQLENDFLFIKKYDKLVHLPCEPNIIFILEDYVQNYIQTSLQSGTKSGQHEDCDKRLNLCKEVVDGLRIYFDFTLPNILLYNSEMKQYEYYSTHFKSNCVYKQRNLSPIPSSPSCDIAPHPSPSIDPALNPNNLSFDCNQHHEESLAVDELDSESSHTQEIVDSSSQEDICDAQSSQLLSKEIEDCSVSDRTISSTEKDSCLSTASTKKIDSPESASTSLHKHSPKRFYNASLTRCRHCQEALSWSILPSSVYDNENPVPSLIYGAHHLLRLFVKLPELLSRSNMPLKKIRLLGKHLQTFLRYLDDKRDEFFQDSDYIDFKEHFDVTHPTLVR